MTQLLPLLVASVAVALSVAAAPAPSTERQKELLEEILRTLPKSEPWEQWLKASGEMPPDFDKLPGIPFLPEPLIFANGHKAIWNDWPKRREELLRLLQHYVTGSWPASPTNVAVAEFKERDEGGSLLREVTLEFGPARAAKLRVELILPDARPRTSNTGRGSEESPRVSLLADLGRWRARRGRCRPR